MRTPEKKDAACRGAGDPLRKDGDIKKDYVEWRFVGVTGQEAISN